MVVVLISEAVEIEYQVNTIQLPFYQIGSLTAV